MPYYIRILGTQNPDINLDSLIKSVEESGISAQFSLTEDEQPERWTTLLVADKARGEDMLVIERNPVVEGELGAEELNEFRESTPDFLPVSAAAWLNGFFDRVKVIYAFQILNAVESEEDWALVSAVKVAIWEVVGGILQADAEGFSNENGFHILWQFDDEVAGSYHMAVLQGGEWVDFTMQLEDLKQREAFFAGQVPAGL